MNVNLHELINQPGAGIALVEMSKCGKLNDDYQHIFLIEQIEQVLSIKLTEQQRADMYQVAYDFWSEIECN